MLFPVSRKLFSCPPDGSVLLFSSLLRFCLMMTSLFNIVFDDSFFFAFLYEASNKCLRIVRLGGLSRSPTLTPSSTVSEVFFTYRNICAFFHLSLIIKNKKHFIIVKKYVNQSILSRSFLISRKILCSSEGPLRNHATSRSMACCHTYR